MTSVYFILLLTENAGITPIRRTAPAVFLLAVGVIAYTGIGKDFFKKTYSAAFQ